MASVTSRLIVHTVKRHYVNVHELRDAERVLAELGDCIVDDYDRQALCVGVLAP